MTTVGGQAITTYGRRVRIPRSPLTRALVIGVPAVVLLSGQVSAASRNVSWGVGSGPSAADPAWLSSLTGAQVAEPDGGLDPVGDPNQAVLPDGGDPAHLSAANDGLVVAALPAGSTAGAATPGDTTLPAGLVSNGIPVRVLQSYLAAASVMSRRQPSCHLSWSLLAGIGRVESDHGRHAGNRIGLDGVVRPGVYGPRLDGSTGTAVIRDTDGGRYDGDGVYDRAVGPMQFIPGTWKGYGTDANGDGVADPQNMDDATLSAGRYLCASGRDLGTSAGRWSAILTYNYSNDYAATVSALADSYATGVVAAVPTAPAGVTPPPASTVTPGTTTLAPKVVPAVAPPATTPPVTQPGDRPTVDPGPTTPPVPHDPAAVPSATPTATTGPTATGTASPPSSSTPTPSDPGAGSSTPSPSSSATSAAATPGPSDTVTAPSPTGGPATPTPTDSPSVAAVTTSVAASPSQVTAGPVDTGSPLPTVTTAPVTPTPEPSVSPSP